MEPDRASSLRALIFGALGVAAIHFGGALMRASSPVWGIFLTLWVVLPALTLATASATRRAESGVIDTLRVRAFHPRFALGALLLAPAFVAIADALHAWEQRLLPLALHEQAPVHIDELSLLARWLLLVASPALCEELFFRGALLSGLRRGLSPLTCALAEGVFFAAAHASTGSFLPAALFGVALTLLVLASGSVVPAIVMHASYNALLLASGTIGEEGLSRLAWAGIPGALLVTWPTRRE